MIEDRAPSLGKAAFVCPNCKAPAQQHWLKLGSRRVDHADIRGWDLEAARTVAIREAAPKNDEDAALKVLATRVVKALDTGSPGLSSEDAEWMHPLLNAQISECFACNREALWLNGKIIFPSRSVEAPQVNEDLPDDIAADYEEAASVLVQSPRAAAALLRLAIQKLCSHLLGRPGDIDEMIGELVKRGLSSTIQQALDVVRVIGNESVHPGTLDLKDDVGTATRLFALVNVIAEGMITHPKHLQELYALIPPNKLKGIEDRNRRTLASPKTSSPDDADEP